MKKGTLALLAGTTLGLAACSDAVTSRELGPDAAPVLAAAPGRGIEGA